MLVERPEDMSPDGKLSLFRDSEGDIHIKVIPSIQYPQGTHTDAGVG